MNYVEMFTPSEGIAVGDGQYVAGSGWTPPAVLRTTDGGVHWNSMNTEPIGYSTDVWRTMCFLSSDVGFYFGTEAVPASGLFSTVNSGASWSEMGLNLSGASVVKFYDNMIGIVVALPGYKSIFRTTDGGATWQNVVQPFSGYAQDVEFVPGNPDRVWLGGFGGLFYSADTGKTWTNVLPGVFRDIDFVNAEIGWAVGDSIIYLTTTGGVVSVGAGENRMPSTFSLEQNYPNPFNPSTTIRYGLPDRSYVTIVVFNTAGQKVATLVDGETEAGYHEVRFDASRLASGVYLYRLQAGSYVETRKLLFVR